MRKILAILSIVLVLLLISGCSVPPPASPVHLADSIEGRPLLVAHFDQYRPRGYEVLGDMDSVEGRWDENIRNFNNFIASPNVHIVTVVETPRFGGATYSYTVYYQAIK